MNWMSRMTSQWRPGGWRTSRSVCRTPAPPGKHTFPAGTSSGRGPDPLSWCQTAWAAWPGRPLAPGPPTETLRCRPLKNISTETKISVLVSYYNRHFKCVYWGRLLLQKPSIHISWRWSWLHRWGTWERRRHTQDCILGGWCHRRTVLWVSKCEGRCGWNICNVKTHFSKLYNGYASC